MERVKELYRYFSDKRFSTIAGTLVYFMLMSIAPFTMWLTLVCGNVDVSRLLSNEFFESISPFLRYLKSSVESAASGAGIILLVTSLYSSTNFFYHLRRSGEIIYNSKRVKSGIKLRLASLALIFAAILLTVILTACMILGSWFLDNYLNPIVSDIIVYSFVTAVAFWVALILNLFACPYKRAIADVVPGALLTTALWLASLIGFTVYMQFATPEKLYGKIAFLIIFLLWCYILMNSFVIGIIYNGRNINEKVYKTLL